MTLKCSTAVNEWILFNRLLGGNLKTTLYSTLLIYQLVEIQSTDINVTRIHFSLIKCERPMRKYQPSSTTNWSYQEQETTTNMVYTSSGSIRKAIIGEY